MKRDLLPTHDAILAVHAVPGRSLLAVLHAIQDEVGFIPKDIIAPLARVMGVSRAEVFGVVSYYHHFRDRPPARLRIALCRAESCRSMGGEALVEHAQRVTGCAIDAERHARAQQGDDGGSQLGSQPDNQPYEDAPTPDVSLESVYCLGLCAQSPSMMMGERVYARVDAVRFDALLQQATAQEMS